MIVARFRHLQEIDASLGLMGSPMVITCAICGSQLQDYPESTSAAERMVSEHLVTAHDYDRKTIAAIGFAIGGTAHLMTRTPLA